MAVDERGIWTWKNRLMALKFWICLTDITYIILHVSVLLINMAKGNKWWCFQDDDPRKMFPGNSTSCAMLFLCFEVYFKELGYAAGIIGELSLQYNGCRRQIYYPISKEGPLYHSCLAADQILASTGKQISQKTVTRQLQQGGLYDWWPIYVKLWRLHCDAIYNGIVNIRIGLEWLSLCILLRRK